MAPSWISLKRVASAQVFGTHDDGFEPLGANSTTTAIHQEQQVAFGGEGEGQYLPYPPRLLKALVSFTHRVTIISHGGGHM